MSVYPYWFHEILYFSTRQYVTSYVDVFHSGDIGTKNGNGVGVYALLMLLTQPLVVGKVEYYGINYRSWKLFGQTHGTQKYFIFFSSQFLQRKLFCPMVYNFKSCNPPVKSSSRLTSVITLSLFQILATQFHVTRQIRWLFVVLLEIIRHYHSNEQHF